MKKYLLSLTCLSMLIIINPQNTQALFGPIISDRNSFTSFIINELQAYLQGKRPNKKPYPKEKGLILVTSDKYKNLVPLGHSALVINQDYVYEATAEGVVRGLNNWDKTKEHFLGLKVKDVSKNQINHVIDYVKKQLNKQYNFDYFNTSTREKFYCSQLIYAAFKDTLNINLDTKSFGQAGVDKVAAIYPMELVDSKMTDVVYQQ